MDEKTLRVRVDNGLKVEDMTRTEGWNIFLDELNDLQEQKTKELINAESEEARACIKAISSIKATVISIVGQGKRAQEELKGAVK